MIRPKVDFTKPLVGVERGDVWHYIGCSTIGKRHYVEKGDGQVYSVDDYGVHHPGCQLVRNAPAPPEEAIEMTSDHAAEQIARLFHDTYERLAPEYGYKTRPDTKQFDPETPNGRLMVAVARVVIDHLFDLFISTAPKPQVHPVQRFFNQQQAWSYATFGPREHRGPAGPLDHLAKEAREAKDAVGTPELPIEIADCLFLVFDAVHRAGMTLEQQVEVAMAKLELNKLRKWPDWRTTDPTKATEHDRTGE